jgi:hypothetical protein
MDGDFGFNTVGTRKTNLSWFGFDCLLDEFDCNFSRENWNEDENEIVMNEWGIFINLH